MRQLRRAMWRDVLARRAQFVAVWATILLGVALFGASYDAFQNLHASYQGMYDSLRFADLTVTGGPIGQIAADGARVPGVAAATTRAVGDGLLRIAGRTQLGRVVGLPTDGQPAVDRVMVLRGQYLDPARTDQVLVEQHLAGNLAPGATLDVATATGWRTMTVAGIVASPEYLWPARSRQEVLVPPDQWGVVFGSEALVNAMPSSEVHTEALFRLAAGAAPETVQGLTRLAIADGATSAQTRAEQPSNSALQEDVSGFGEMSVMFPILFLLAGALATSVLLGRLIASQRGQIGALRANGAERGTILRHYLAFGMGVGIAGSIPGAFLGAISADAISRLYTGAIAVPVTVVQVRPATIVVGLLMGPAAGAVAAWLPARRAARTDPAEAMRGAVPVGRGGRSLAERLLPPLQQLPTRWLVSLRGLGRSPRRSVSTIIGVALATTLVLVSWGMIDTTQILLDRQFLQVQRQDATLYLSAPVPASQVAGLIHVPGVAAVEPQLQLAATIVHGSQRYPTTLVGLEPSTTMHTFLTSNDRQLALAARGILLGSALQGLLGVSAGSSVLIDTASGRPVSVPVAGFVDEPLGTLAYGSLATVAAVRGSPSGDPMVDSALVRYAAGADGTAVEAALSAVPAVAGVSGNRTIYDLAQRYMGLFYVFIAVMLVLGGVMAFALLFNTMTANVAERSTELAALRTLGMSSGTISRLVTGENLLLTVAGLCVGLVVGYAVAAEFMASFSSDLFNFDLHVRPTTFLFTSLAVLVVGLLSQWPALRAVRRVDLGRLVRERSV